MHIAPAKSGLCQAELRGTAARRMPHRSSARLSSAAPPQIVLAKRPRCEHAKGFSLQCKPGYKTGAPFPSFTVSDRLRAACR